MDDISLKDIFSNFSSGNTDVLKAVESEALRSHASIIEESHVKIQEKQHDLENILANMRKKYDSIKQEEEKLALERKHELDQSLQNAKDEQKQNQEKQERSLAEQRNKLDALKAQAMTRISEMPLEKQKSMQKRLEELLQMAFLKQKELEDRQYRNTIREQEELSMLARQAQEEQHRIHQEQINNMKRDLDDLVKNAAKKEKEIEEEFRLLAKSGQQEISNLITGARDKQNKIKDKYKNKLEENKHFMKSQILLTQEFIKQGKIDEVKKIQKEMEDVIRKCKEDMHEEHKTISVVAKRELHEVTEFAETSQKNILKRQKELIKQAKEMMDKQAESHMKKIQQNLTIQTRDSIENLKTQMLSRHKNMQAEQIDMIKQVATNMEKQAEDSKRRRYREQKEIITTTRQSIINIEERAQTEQKKIEKEHKDMVDGARSSLLEIERQAALSQRYFESEQKDIITQSIAEAETLTQHLGNQKRKEEWERVQVSREKSRHDIGKESYENLRKIEQEKRIASMQAKLEMVSVGKHTQELKEQLQKERDDLVRIEAKETLELKQSFADRQKMLEREHLKRVRKEQIILDEVILNANLRRERIEEEMKDIEDVIGISTAKQGKIKTLESSQEHEELLRLINLAKIKHKEIISDQEKVIENVKRTMEEKVMDSQKILANEQKKLLDIHQKELEDLAKNTEDRRKRLKEEQDMLFKRQDENMKLIMSEAEDEQQNIRNEHMKILYEAQKKLTDIEKGDVT